MDREEQLTMVVCAMIAERSPWVNDMTRSYPGEALVEKAMEIVEAINLNAGKLGDSP